MVRPVLSLPSLSSRSLSSFARKDPLQLPRSPCRFQHRGRCYPFGTITPFSFGFGHFNTTAILWKSPCFAGSALRTIARNDFLPVGLFKTSGLLTKDSPYSRFPFSSHPYAAQPPGCGASAVGPMGCGVKTRMDGVARKGLCLTEAPRWNIHRSSPSPSNLTFSTSHRQPVPATAGVIHGFSHTKPHPR